LSELRIWEESSIHKPNVEGSLSITFGKI